MKHRDKLLFKRTFIILFIIALCSYLGYYLTPEPLKPLPTRSRKDIQKGIEKAEEVCGHHEKPWMKEAEYKLILKYLMPHYEMLEWGAGKSSCLWSTFVTKLMSIEHNVKWAGQVKEHLQTNQQVMAAPRNKRYAGYRIRKKPTPANAYNEYIHAPEYLGAPYDAILVDGRARPQCAFEALFLLRNLNSMVFIHDYYSNIPDRSYYHIVERWYDIVESVPGTPGMVVLRPKELKPKISKDEFPEWWFENYNQYHDPILA